MNCDYLSKQLHRLINQEKYIEIYHGYENAFAVGNIIDVLDDYVLYQCVAPDGRYDGFVVEPIDSISKICTETKYIKYIIKLISFENSQVETDNLKNGLVSSTDSLLHRLLTLSLDNKLCIALQLGDDSSENITGVIESLSDSGLCLKNIDEYGCFDGVSYIRISDIYRVTCDDITQRSLKRILELS